MKYKLIALDMDGTVLNEKKEITEVTANAIHDAIAAGIHVVFCTGRSYAEMRKILEEYPDMHYLCGESGALVYDLKEKVVVEKATFPLEVIKILYDEAKGKNLMPCVFADGECLVNKKDVTHMADFYMGQCQDSYETVTTKFDDVLDMMVTQKRTAEKINFYCGSIELREQINKRMKERNLDATYVYSEITSLEFTPLGLTKAYGLSVLCKVLNISMNEVVMVGDADNDLAALKAAGLPIAMGNANERVKAVAAICVEDNEHDGCAQAIRYAMGEGIYDKTDCI